MPISRRIGHPYPSQNTRDWFDDFENFVKSLDASDYAAREDRNIFLAGGAPLSIGPTGEVSWGTDLMVFYGSRGVAGRVESGSVDLSDGDFAYVELVRYPGGEYDLQLKTSASSAPNNDHAMVLFYRYGDGVWVRGSGFYELGSLVNGTYLNSTRTPVSVALNESQGEGERTLGRYRLNPDKYRHSDLPVAAIYRCEAQVTGPLLGGTISLYDVTEGNVLIDSFDVLTDQPFEHSTPFTPAVEGERVYEVRAGLWTTGQPKEVTITIDDDSAPDYTFTDLDNALDYSYTRLSGDSSSDIASGLSSAINGSARFTSTADGDVVTVTAVDNGDDFSYQVSTSGSGDPMSTEVTQAAAKDAPYTEDELILIWHATLELVAAATS